MDVGVRIPNGCNDEFWGWKAERAWDRMMALAHQSEEIGFESIWVLDHLHTMPEPTNSPVFESFTSIAAFAASTSKVRLGHLVMCAGFRNPALVAKMVSTLDVISGGRMELGIGAGWKEDEWRAYGYGFPSTSRRLLALRDQLEVITRLLDTGLATYEGAYASVSAAISQPRGLQQPRLPIMVGGNGRNVTWRLAARYADELNLDGLSPDELRAALPIISDRCREVDRDPTTLRVSVNIFADRIEPEGPDRVTLLSKYRDLGVSRVMAQLRRSVHSDSALERFAEDAVRAGAHLGA